MTTIPTTVKNQKLVEKRREQIVLAAIKLFSQKGFHKTTLRDLSEAAELSYGNVYDYVGGKEDIIYLIHEYVYGLILDGLHASVAQVTDPIEKLKRMVRFEFSVMDQTAEAILILYHYSHILKNEYLYKLLKAEREHIQQFENVLRECIEHGLTRKCNIRMTANLIKSMIDSWVLKRWDLRGDATVSDAEKEILDMALHGLAISKAGAEQRGLNRFSFWEGRTVLLVNGGTVLGSAICSDLSAKGARIGVVADQFAPSRENPIRWDDSERPIRLFPKDEYGSLSMELYRRIVSEMGSIDIFVQELGVGTTDLPGTKSVSLEAARQLEANFNMARELGMAFVQDATLRPLSRIIFIAPWAWDRYVSPILSETILGGLEALTRELGRSLAASQVGVNCIVPGFIKSPRPSAIEKSLTSGILSHIPAGRLGRVDDVANAVVFMAGDDSEYATGQTIRISGGLISIMGEKEDAKDCTGIP